MTEVIRYYRNLPVRVQLQDDRIMVKEAAPREDSDQISRTQISESEQLLESGSPWQPAVLAYVSEISKRE
jgi:hypothetical protein